MNAPVQQAIVHVVDFGVTAEQAAVEAAERQARLEALRPDRERLVAYAAALLAVPVPEVQDAGAAALLVVLRTSLTDLAADLEGFGQ